MKHLPVGVLLPSRVSELFILVWHVELVLVFLCCFPTQFLEDMETTSWLEIEYDLYSPIFSMPGILIKLRKTFKMASSMLTILQMAT